MLLVLPPLFLRIPSSSAPAASLSDPRPSFRRILRGRPIHRLPPTCASPTYGDPAAREFHICAVPLPPPAFHVQGLVWLAIQRTHIGGYAAVRATPTGYSVCWRDGGRRAVHSSFGGRVPAARAFMIVGWPVSARYRCCGGIRGEVGYDVVRSVRAGHSMHDRKKLHRDTKYSPPPHFPCLRLHADAISMEKGLLCGMYSRRPRYKARIDCSNPDSPSSNIVFPPNRVLACALLVTSLSVRKAGLVTGRMSATVYRRALAVALSSLNSCSLALTAYIQSTTQIAYCAGMAYAFGSCVLYTASAREWYPILSARPLLSTRLLEVRRATLMPGSSVKLSDELYLAWVSRSSIGIYAWFSGTPPLQLA
ncbi:hypothetical protein C8J57DRAFT_1521622 [Mycena rebaudengoi]|nr:hypothetical protein C8J57DRAFT_1521622 [Mycena rebaudengoi]